MTSKPVAWLLADLGVTKPHSRPQVSNDNPYSAAPCKTLKYRPDFPERFGSLEEARAFCQPCFSWDNTEHRHSGIGMLTPEMVHAQTLQAAFDAHPERLKGKKPAPAPLPRAVWINQPVAGPEDKSVASLQ